MLRSLLWKGHWARARVAIVPLAKSEESIRDKAPDIGHKERGKVTEGGLSAIRSVTVQAEANKGEEACGAGNPTHGLDGNCHIFVKLREKWGEEKGGVWVGRWTTESLLIFLKKSSQYTVEQEESLGGVSQLTAKTVNEKEFSCCA